MTDPDTKKLLIAAEAAAREAGALLVSYTPNVVKSWDKDMKIDADAAVHKLILEKLHATRIPVLSEEDTAHDFGNGRKWIIDPLDGSINFLRGIPACAVSIALWEGGEPLLGVIYDFNRGELFSGVVGSGATLNGEKMSVSSVSGKGEAVLMTGFPSHTDFSTEALQQYVSFVQTFKKIRLLGSAALSLAYVACGRADAYYEKDIYIWDVAAGLALVKAAGGKYEMGAIDAEGKCTVFAGNERIVLKK